MLLALSREMIKTKIVITSDRTNTSTEYLYKLMMSQNGHGLEKKIVNEK